MIDSNKVLGAAMLISLALLTLVDITGTGGVVRLAVSLVVFPLLSLFITWLFGIVMEAVGLGHKLMQPPVMHDLEPEVIIGELVGQSTTVAGSLNGDPFPEWVDILQAKTGDTLRYYYHSVEIPNYMYPVGYIVMTFGKAHLVYAGT
jgi:hypothetical protein